MVRRHENVVKLGEWLKTKTPGDRISFLEIEDSSKVAMTPSGKGHLRYALKMMSMPYISIRGYGIELVNANNALDAVGVQTCRVVSVAKRAKNETQLISDKFYHDMCEHDKKSISNQLFMFNMIQTEAENILSTRHTDSRKREESKGSTHEDMQKLIDMQSSYSSQKQTVSDKI